MCIRDSVYAANVRLPEGSPELARESLSDALAVAEGNTALIEAAKSAYDTSYLVTMAVLAMMLLIGAITTNRLLQSYGRGTEAMAYAENH